MLNRIAIRFAYDGSRFESFARQPSRRTVEGELLRSLKDIGVIGDVSKARYGVASRTDRGVSAWENVCAVDVDMDPRTVAHNARPPDGLWFLAAAAVPPDFSPRHAATRRTYRYFVHDAGDLDWVALKEGLRCFVGTHDFANFCRREAGTSTQRRIDDVAARRRGDIGWIQVTAPNFLWEQVRRIVHSVLAVGRAQKTIATLERQLNGTGPIEPPAPPEPLVLEAVDVPVVFPSPSSAVRRRLQSARSRAAASWSFHDGLASSLPTVRR